MQPCRQAPSHTLLAAGAAAAIVALAAAGCAGQAAAGGMAGSCWSGAMAGLPGLRITPATDLPADDKGEPAHCLVPGALPERTGSDGKRYAIGFEIRLPQIWTRRFLHQDKGGNDAVVKPAFGDLGVMPTDALARGFAVISIAGGHSGEDPANLPAGLAHGNLFGLDPPARRDYGCAATDALWPEAQGLIAAR